MKTILNNITFLNISSKNPKGDDGSKDPNRDDGSKELVANIVGGFTQATLVTGVGYPLDLVKGRLQAGAYPDTISCLKGTVKNEGFMGLYRGSAMPWLSHSVKRTIQYPVIEYFKSQVAEPDKKINPIYNYAIGGLTGALGPIVGTPLQVVKISVQTSTDTNKDSKTKNSWYYIKHNYQKNGIRGFYRGFLSTVAKDCVFGASFIGTYYTLRDLIGADTMYKNFFNGATAHCITWCVFIPIDYVKTTIQKSEIPMRVRDVIYDSYKQHGVRVFWKGVVPACLRTIPVSGVAMVGYEQVRSFILKTN